jgi:predicted nucleic acid-binding protein
VPRTRKGFSPLAKRKRNLAAAYPGQASVVSYVALAESLGMPLLTGDTRLAMASGHSTDVQIYPLAPP